MSGKHFTFEESGAHRPDDVAAADASIDVASAKGYLYTQSACPGSDKIPIGPDTYCSMQPEGDGIDVYCCACLAEEISRKPANESGWWKSVFTCSNGHEIAVTWTRYLAEA